MLRGAEKVWIVPNPRGERHPAIVIRVSPDGSRALVLSGTGTGPRDIPHELVDPRRRVGMSLRLTKPTYFYSTAVHVRKTQCPAADGGVDRDPIPLRCPPALWERLQALASVGAREKLSLCDFREWWPVPGEE